MYLKKTLNAQGRIRLSIVDNYYDKQKKCSRQKTIESIGFLDELEKIYEDPISHLQKRIELLNHQQKGKQAPINLLTMILTVYVSEITFVRTSAMLLLVRFIMNSDLILSSIIDSVTLRNHMMPTLA